MKSKNLVAFVAIFSCLVSVQAAAEIPTDIPYGQDVEGWWGQHVFNRKTPLIHPDETYLYYGHRMIGNVVESSSALVEFDQANDYLSPEKDNKVLLGKFQIRGNKTISMGELVYLQGVIEKPI